jgi:hypothetical protein
MTITGDKNSFSDLIEKGSPVAVMILSNEFLRSRVLFTIIYKVYILIYNPDPSRLKGSK